MTYFHYQTPFMEGQLVLGQGRAVIVTGWTQTKPVKVKFDQLESGSRFYAAIGNLYSAAGINFLVRNILANGHVNRLIILMSTQQDRIARSCEALLALMTQGVSESTYMGKKVWAINGPAGGHIDYEIPLEAINHLRSHLKVTVADSIKEVVDQAISWSNKEQVNPSPVVPSQEFYYEPPPEADILSGNLYGHTVRGQGITASWLKLVKLVRSYGKIIPSAYGSKWQELIDIITVIEPDDRPLPSWVPASPEFMQMWYAPTLRAITSGAIQCQAIILT